MASPALQDWVFWLAGALLGAAGLFLAAWALFWDRPRARKRCPQCWYSMDGAPGLLCPECGRTAKSAAHLFRTRRRWRFLCSALFLFLLAWAAASVPRVKQGGWTGAIPSTVLAMFAPADDTAMRTASAARFQTIRTLRLNPTPQPSWSFDRLRSDLSSAAWDRVYHGSMSRWQSEILVARFLSNTDRNLLDSVKFPSRWIAGEDLPVLLSRPDTWFATAPPQLPGEVRVRGADPLGRSSSYERTIDTVATPARPADTLALPLELRIVLQSPAVERVIYGKTYRVPVVLVADPDQLLLPLDTPEATALVRAALDVRLVRLDGAVYLVADDRAQDDRWKAVDFGLAYRVEVMLDGKVVGHAESAANWDYPVWKDWNELPVEWTEGGAASVLERSQDARFVVTGRRDPAIAQYRDSPFNKPNAAAWTGSYEAPLRVDDVVQKARP